MDLFAKIDVSFTDDIKVRRAGPLPRLLYLQLVLWSKRKLTDGVLPAEFLADVAVDISTPKKHLGKLLAVGLLEECEEGWRIPLDAWTEWNMTAEQVKSVSQPKREGAQRGNHNRWHSMDSPSDSCDLCHEAGWLAPPSGEEMAQLIAYPISDDRQRYREQRTENREAGSDVSPVPHPQDVDELLKTTCHLYAVHREREYQPKNSEGFIRSTAAEELALNEERLRVEVDVLSESFDREVQPSDLLVNVFGLSAGQVDAVLRYETEVRAVS